MKIFELEFRYDNETGLKDGDVGTWKNPFRVRMMYPRNEEYHSCWSYNHRVMEKEFQRIYNPLINNSSYERKYWVQAIRRVR